MKYAITEAEAIVSVGTLSNPSKMPGKGTSTPASACITGSKLRQIPGSVCHGCYAMKGCYQFANVKPALANRLSLVHDSKANPEPWIAGMVRLIWNQDYFRWHDSGDLQGTWHLQNIIEVARRTPHIKHWLPTREYGTVRQVLSKDVAIPDNLVIRLSAHMVDGDAPWQMGFPTSTVVTDDSATCPARHQNNECRDCRACWSPEVANVSYHKH